jgi:Family of unknown function (DUF6188)
VATCDVAGPDDDRPFPLGGRVVQQLRVDHQLTLLLDDAVITIEARATLDAPDLGVPVALVPCRQEVSAALRLFGMEIVAAAASDDGSLRVEFSESVVLHVGVQAGIEAWSITGPGDLRATCTPEGRLVFGGTT